MAVFTAMTFSACGAAPTPLYHQYQESFGLTPFVLTVVFAAYVVSLLAALLTIGSLSDYIGRRPAIMAALALNIVAMVMFVAADSAGALIVARAVQGFATGLATATLGATILDTDRIRGPVLNRSNLRPRVFHVRFGSLAGMAASNLDVCLIPKSGHWPIARRCLLQATSGGIPYQIRDHQTISRPRR
jgi:MFS family permease